MQCSDDEFSEDNLSLSSQTLFSTDSVLPTFLSAKEESLKVCVEEVNVISKTLNDRCDLLKRWRKDLQRKEQTMVKLCDSVSKYVESEVSSRSKDVLEKNEEKYSEISKKYNTLYKNYQRLKQSFESLKIQNKALKTEIDKHLLTEDVMKKEKEKLVVKVDILRTKNDSKTPLNKRTVSSQTRSNTVVVPELRLDATGSFTSLLRELWSRMFHMCVRQLFRKDIHEDKVDSFSDICLLVIPVSVEYLRGIVLTNSPTCLSAKNSKDVLVNYMEMLYWSVIYMDFTRLPIRPGMMSPMTRLGEDVTVLLVPNSSSSSSSLSLRRLITGDDHLHALVILFAIRCVSRKDLLSLLLKYLSDMVSTHSHMWSILLSKYMYIPLLCRWTSSCSSYSPLYPNILGIVQDSLCHKTGLCEPKSLMFSIEHDGSKVPETGLDMLVSLTLSMSIHVSDTMATNYTNHPLVFLLDILLTTKSNERASIMDIIDKLIHHRSVRLLCQDLGIVGILSTLIAQGGLSCSSDPKSCPSNHCDRLKSILSDFTSRR